MDCHRDKAFYGDEIVMQGNIRQLPSGHWAVRWQLQRTVATREEAERMVAECVVKVELPPRTRLGPRPVSPEFRERLRRVHDEGGLSDPRVAEDLNRAGLRTPRGKLWRASTLSALRRSS